VKVKARVLLIDNYDSFTYNLSQHLEVLGAEVFVRRNDEIIPEDIEALSPTHLVISPGPGRPEGAGISCRAVETLAGEMPILGVCLGHQAIGYAMGATVERGPSPVHGKTSEIHHDGEGLFRGLPVPFEATRYHSLVVSRSGLPACLEVSGITGDGVVMGIRHREFPVEGVQFHPESILTEHGGLLLDNFLGMG
jgi:anthranilate synthase/aminodeoxychorismate synthase-like glutamine amidotransferase